MSYTLQYRRAFAAIGDGQVVEAMKSYLPDSGFLGFGFDAACTLKDIWDRKQNLPKEIMFKVPVDFSEMKTRRIERQTRGDGGASSPFADAIITVIDDTTRPGSSEEAISHALQLAKVAFSMPYGAKEDTIERIMQLPLPLSEKRDFFTVIVVAGEIIQADLIFDGLKSVLEKSKAKRWVSSDENWWQLEEWLELMPFSDRPGSIVDALDFVKPSPPPWRMQRVLSALGYAPSVDAEGVLGLLARNDARYLNERYWFVALDRRGTSPSAHLLLDLICEGRFEGVPEVTHGLFRKNWRGP
jgi:hypothetical protein